MVEGGSGCPRPMNARSLARTLEQNTWMLALTLPCSFCPRHENTTYWNCL